MGDTLAKLFVEVGDVTITNPYNSSQTFEQKLVPDDGYGFVQLLFMAVVYGYILFTAANLIGDGSELLVLMGPSFEAIVGPVILPILGAVPDGAIVIFSGLGPIATAQEQLLVGVGALAGSTIMLLTIPWALAIYAGRVCLDWEQADDYGSLGKGSYKKPTQEAHERRFLGWIGKEKNELTADDRKNMRKSHEDYKLPSCRGGNDLIHTGLNCGSSIKISGYMMLLTSLGYVIIQGRAFTAKCFTTDQNDSCSHDDEEVWAWVGLVYCILAFFGYLYYQLMYADHGDRYMRIRQQLMETENLDMSVVFDFIWHKYEDEFKGKAPAEELHQPMLVGNLPQVTLSGDDLKLAKKVMRPIFAKFDNFPKNGKLDRVEIRALMNDTFKINMSLQDAGQLLACMGTSDEADLTDFTNGLLNYYHNHASEAARLRKKRQDQLNNAQDAICHDCDDEVNDYIQEEEDEDEEEDEMPEDLVALSPEEQKKALLKRSLAMMLGGTLLCVFFSDPMVDILSEVGSRTGIPAFFVAFIFAPIASNASELVAAYQYATKKTVKRMNISLGQLIGAANMNNTFCLGIFLALIAARPLKWTFTSETISIFFIELVMCYMATKTVHRLLDAAFVISLFPISIILVYILEYQIKLN
jgi:Ca2+/Na+ antiporter